MECASTSSCKAILRPGLYGGTPMLGIIRQHQSCLCSCFMLSCWRGFKINNAAGAFIIKSTAIVMHQERFGEVLLGTTLFLIQISRKIKRKNISKGIKQNAFTSIMLPLNSLLHISISFPEFTKRSSCLIFCYIFAYILLNIKKNSDNCLIVCPFTSQLQSWRVWYFLSLW